VESKKPIRKVIVGKVLSDKMDKSITIECESRKLHPIYKKFVKVHSKVKVHDGKNTAKLGDVVEVIKCRPMSKEKSWRLVKVIEKA